MITDERLSSKEQKALAEFLELVRKENPHEPEFVQAVTEVAKYVYPYELRNPEYREARVLYRLTVPDRLVMFRVVWRDDAGRIRVNRGYRVQMTNLLGPYKGGLRFHPTVTLSVVKFLAFEQIFKNSLTTLPLGAGKGGADFDPKGKSEAEIKRFCQAFMLELHRHIGRYMDVPAGDIGVGPREIGYMYGMYIKLRGYEPGAITGKSPDIGGSLLRVEATGYGLLYFVEEMLKRIGESLEGKIVAISGAGNVALHAAEKAIEMGAKVVTLSDSTGCLYVPAGISKEQLEIIKSIKSVRGRSLKEAEGKLAGARFYGGKKPWGVRCDIALPCATQNELDLDDAKQLVANGCRLVAEGANMPCTEDAVEYFLRHDVLVGPGKAANAGGVAVSGLEMIQNASRWMWSRDEVDRRLREIMKRIHETCVRFGTDESGKVNYVKGANIGGYERVARAMIQTDTI